MRRPRSAGDAFGGKFEYYFASSLGHPTTGNRKVGEPKRRI